MRHIGSVVHEISRDWQGGTVTRRPREIALALPLDETRPGVPAKAEIVLPYLPPSKNVYDSWPGEWKSGCKQKWIRDIVAECEAQMLPKGLPKIALCARLEFPTARHRDPQNYANTLWNFVPDALENRRHGQRWGYGLIPDDRDGRILYGKHNLGVVMALDERRVDDKHKGRTKIVITWRMPA